jgi:predicted metal-binding membrane protein
MAQTTAAHPKQRELRNVKTLLSLAIVSALIAAVAGLVFLIVSPEKDSVAEGALGITAASGGFATAGFAVAAIYAQIKNLWQYAPMWVRVFAWAVIAFAVITTVWNWIT